MRVRAAALAASLALLAGCAPVQLPAGLTESEITARIAEGNQRWWTSMFPDEPMPVVEPVEYVDAAHVGKYIQDCMKSAHIEGVIFGEDLSWVYLGDDPAVSEQLDRQYFVCVSEYPFDPEGAFLSDEQLRWQFYYNRDRLVPCLQLLGYSIINRTTDYVDGDNWIPYYEMYPLPTASEWERIDLRCPPSPVGPVCRPTSG